MSLVLKLLSAVSPQQPTPAPREYSGLEFRKGIFTFRPAAFQFEGIALGLIGVFLVLYLLGKRWNQSRAEATIAPYLPLINSQFSLVRPLLSSGPALHLLYASGRRSVLALHTTISLLPYHDVATLIYSFARSIVEPTYDVSETITFDLTLGLGSEGLQGEAVGVWGIVDKSALRDTREKRWDLTFPRLHDTAAVPITHVLFAEHSDSTDALLKTPNVGIAMVLADPIAAGVLKYLLVSDVPGVRPSKGPQPAKIKSRHVILALHKPANQQQVDAAKAWLQVALNVADLLSKPNLIKPEVTRKFIKTRQTVDADLSSDYKKELALDAEPSTVELTAEEKRAAKKKAERSTLSEKELKKLDELDKKREMRKLAKKQQTR